MEKHEIIAHQNDLFRRFHMPPDGAKNCKEAGILGRFFFTDGVSHKGLEFQLEVIAAIGKFCAFDEGNNPHAERDFGQVKVLDTHVFWKLDYYNLDFSAGSEEPENPLVTRRVLTLMLPSEY